MRWIAELPSCQITAVPANQGNLCVLRMKLGKCSSSNDIWAGEDRGMFRTCMFCTIYQGDLHIACSLKFVHGEVTD